MTKAELASAVSVDCGLSHAESLAAIESVMNFEEKGERLSSRFWYV